jgi:putative ATPase
MRDLGYGKGYKYAHDEPEAMVDQEHLPEELSGRVYYQPTDRGREKAIGEVLAARRSFLAKKRPKS